MLKSDDALNIYIKHPTIEQMTLKKQLRFYLELNGMSASQLARKANVPKQSLSGWLAGNNPRDVRQVKRIADALSISLDNLMFGNGREENYSSNDLESLFGNEWVCGQFEIKIKRIK